MRLQGDAAVSAAGRGVHWPHEYPGSCPSAGPPAARGASLSPEARRRLRWIEDYLAHDRNVTQTCWHFDISRETFYRWWRRYDPRRLQSLEDDRRTRRPQRARQPETPPALEARIRARQESHPR